MQTSSQAGVNQTNQEALSVLREPAGCVLCEPACCVLCVSCAVVLCENVRCCCVSFRCCCTAKMCVIVLSCPCEPQVVLCRAVLCLRLCHLVSAVLSLRPGCSVLSRFEVCYSW
ncbi:hypothetical protein AVEN_98081-1 [Araneus ventricosus]|uniref:Uncharacterized protein n=1 Tax=Araneus ventricosus TaxID=182803 RepID=A0A4Y2VH64_ARAVE|nr:hypothetical protein AVEN_98081-1 [Araneus ventricosus]